MGTREVTRAPYLLHQDQRGERTTQSPGLRHEQFSEPIGPDDYGYRPPKNRDPNVTRLKGKIKMLAEDNTSLRQEYEQAQNEIRHYKDRVVRVEEFHRLEVQRLRKEVDYHKRLRLGADQRAFELEERLRQQQRQTSTFDEAQSSLIEQSQLLVSKNAELAYKIKTLETQVLQQQQLQGCLEEQLEDVLRDRDRLEGELQELLEKRQDVNGLRDLKLVEEDEDHEEDEGDEG
ncbi:hypothetical protein CEUSTIGMA_g6025.t1 [Chlamydomonas eustigma]|uniref:Uncharacterized protein n=1 Tax=Chlamydomonas eustigma TaxID=1157962 RepID=A0A250X6B4_9CHLO|nr:hypothetical protein CEUSTIGMA_g6025.t1 [Chlamydomonas eustigma]|eukprot:GAX78586.1 hypothetical protein CEUSTIGMA_g6025.t1 [Chlamydomonas eustigma]